MFQRFFLLLALLSSLALPAQTWPEGWQLPTHGREYRAVWLCTLGGMDWPGRNYAQTPYKAERQKAELRRTLDRLQAAGINTVLFQTRIRSSMAYPSAYEPWDGAFSGTPGVAPPYDVLQFAIDEAHARGMELHAYLVVYPIGNVQHIKALGRQSLPARHPEMVQRCGDQWMMDPGVPATAPYIAGLCREIVEHYDVDGIHLDYIRYPEREIAFNDDRTYRRYGGGKPKAQWRRDNVNRTVQLVHGAVRAVKPWVRLSCSPIGKYSDLPRQSSRGWNARDAVYQDAQLWLKEGWMDVLFPMMYFDAENFYPFAYNWMQQAHGRVVAPGLGIYFLSPREGKWTFDKVERQLQVLRQMGIGGHAFFRSQFLLDNHKGIYDFVRRFNERPALTPAMTWRDATPPARPVSAQRREGNSLRLWWNPVSDATPITYNIYRLDPEGATLIAHHLRTTQHVVTPSLPALLSRPHIVVAMDSYGNESPLPSADEITSARPQFVPYPDARRTVSVQPRARRK